MADPVATDDYERNILQHIEKFGCSVTSVFDPEEKEPSFSYSIGISKSRGAPEVIVVGLGNRLGQSLINHYMERVAAGEQFEFDKDYGDFLEGFPVRFGQVTAEHRKAYMRSTCWLHGGSDFEAVQLIWPSTSGIWPWEPDASDWLRNNQPILSS